MFTLNTFLFLPPPKFNQSPKLFQIFLLNNPWMYLFFSSLLSSSSIQATLSLAQIVQPASQLIWTPLQPVSHLLFIFYQSDLLKKPNLICLSMFKISFAFRVKSKLFSLIYRACQGLSSVFSLLPFLLSVHIPLWSIIMTIE